MHNDIRRCRRARHPSTITPIAGPRQRSVGRDPCMVMIFRPLPMDPNMGPLTIERFDLPALGVSCAARDLATGSVCQGIAWAGNWRTFSGFNVSAEIVTCVIARPVSIDRQRGLDDMPRVRSIRSRLWKSTRHPDTTPKFSLRAQVGDRSPAWNSFRRSGFTPGEYFALGEYRRHRDCRRAFNCVCEAPRIVNRTD